MNFRYNFNVNINLEKKYPWFLIAIIFIVTLYRVYLISIPVWPINGDEAQYWLWSQHLAFGYYSKPPMLAWLIAITNSLLGKTPLGLRLASPILHGLTALVLYFAGKKLFNPQIGFWSSLCYFLSPGVLYASQLISTDTPLLFFWSLALLFWVNILQKNHCIKDWIALAICFGLALLSKYAAIFFIIGMILSAAFCLEKPTILFSKKLLFFLILLLLIISPNLIWNATHHFVSFQAVNENADLNGIQWNFSNLANFFFSQWIIFNPILFIGFLLTIWKIKTVKENKTYTLLLSFILPIFLVMLVESFVSHAHSNWAAPMYVAASIFMAAIFIEYNRIYWLILAAIMNVLINIAMLNIHDFIHYLHIHLDTGMTQTDWKPLQQELEHLKANKKNFPIIINDRILFANVAYFTDLPYEQLYKWNSFGTVHDEFDMQRSFQSKNDKKSLNYLLITYDVNPISVISHFEKNKLISKVEIPTLDGEVNLIYIFYLSHFNSKAKSHI